MLLIKIKCFLNKKSMSVEWQWQLCVNGLEIQGSHKVQNLVKFPCDQWCVLTI